MNSSQLLGCVLAAAALFTACGSSNNNNNNNDAGVDAGDNNPPVEYDDAGNVLVPDASYVGPGTIGITCTAPTAAVPVNTRTTITCTVDSAGKSTSSPVLSSVPPDGIELSNASQNGKVFFALSTGKAGYIHPMNYQDTTYKVTVEVHAAAKPSEFGKATVEVTVLGNYWIGDASSNGQGIYAFRSDGKFQGQIVGQAGIKGVADLCMLPSGDIAASSSSDKLIRIFNRQGMAQNITFEDTDRFAGNLKIWDSGGSGFTDAAPAKMAMSSAGDLWVAGAFENGAYGIAVFNPSTGALQKFVPNPEQNNAFKITSLAHRSDGKMAASSDSRRSVCLFDETTFKPDGDGKSCFAAGDTWSGDFRTMLSMPDGQILVGPHASSYAGLLLLGPTLGTVLTSDKIYMPQVDGLVVSGNEILALGSFGNTCCNPQLAHFDLATLKQAAPPNDYWDVNVTGGSLYNVAGIVRLTPPGK